MNSGTTIALVIMIGLIAAALMRARVISRLTPTLDVAARKHKARIQHSLLGMPQIIKCVGDRVIRMTPMSISLSSPEGGGQMTCVEFQSSRSGVVEFRLREKLEARRNAVPGTFLGANKSFVLDIPHLDARFSGFGNNAAQAKRILTEPAVIEAISALPSGADVRVKDGKCYVSVRGLPYSQDFVDRLFAASESLLASLEAHMGGQSRAARQR